MVNKLSVSELWDLAKWYFQADNQLDQTEKLFELTGNKRICWICGDKIELNLLLIRTSKGVDLEVIHCNDCTGIQQGMELKVLKITKIREKSKCKECGKRVNMLVEHSKRCEIRSWKANKGNRSDENVVNLLQCRLCGVEIDYPPRSKMMAKYMITQACVNCQAQSAIGLVMRNKEMHADYIDRFNEMRDEYHEKME